MLETSKTKNYVKFLSEKAMNKESYRENKMEASLIEHERRIFTHYLTNIIFKESNRIEHRFLVEPAGPVRFLKPLFFTFIMGFQTST